MRKSPMTLQILCIMVALTCLSPLLCTAGVQKDREVEELELYYPSEHIIYSASKRPEPFLESPSAISVLTADDIRYSGAKKLTDVFRMVPGIDVADVNAFYTGVQARGFSFLPKYAREMLVLIDGRSVYTPQINATFWDQLPLFLEDIERIEIIRGPNAALYGANAFNGVINIITKEPAAVQGALLSITAGNRRSQWETVRYGGTAGKLSYRISAGYHETDGFRNVDDHLRKPQTTLRADYTINATSSLSFQTGYAGGERELSKTVQPEVTSWFAMGTYEKKFSPRSRLLVRYYHDYRNSELNFGYPDKLTEDDIEAQYNYDAARIHFVVGAGYRLDRVKNGFLSGRQWQEFLHKKNHDFHLDVKDNRILKAFTNATVRLMPNLLLTGAVMVENNDFVGTMFSPKAVLVYLLGESHSLRLSISRAYRTPSFIEESADVTFPVPFFTPPYVGQRGDNDVKPERMVAYELGYRGLFFNNQLSTNFELFYHNINNIIVYRETEPNIYRYQNFTTNHVRGGEASMAWQVVPWWRLTLAYTYQKATDDYLKGLVIKHKVSFGSRFMLPAGITANVQVSYVDDFHFEPDAWVPKYTVKDYTRCDVRIGKTFFQDRFEVALIGQNLFDPQHYEYPPTLSAGEAPRTCMLELTCRFGGK
ncbi:MAG: TonB-dependent receptor [Desulfobacterota bacterium]|nr:TonB-dependent receptor [Thermodesulfobacteriota bacterium]